MVDQSSPRNPRNPRLPLAVVPHGDKRYTTISQLIYKADGKMEIEIRNPVPCLKDDAVLSVGGSRLYRLQWRGETP